MEPVLLELFLMPLSPVTERARKVTANALKRMGVAVLVERDASRASNKGLAARYGINSFPTLLINRRYKTGIPGSEEELLRILLKAGVTIRT